MHALAARRGTAAIAMALGGLALVALSTTAQAYGYRTCDGSRIRWDRQWSNMYISTTSFPAGSTWDARLQNAMWHWNNVKGSNFNYYVGRDTDGRHANNNGVNEIYLDRGIGGSTLAVTRSRYHCYWLFGWRYGLDETDIAFNGNVTWNLNAIDYSNLNAISFESVALHELGHAMGLGHEDRWMATMNSFYPNSGPVGHYKQWDPLADDRGGARYLYPDSTGEVDIAGSVFQRTGSGTSGLVASATSAARGSNVTIGLTITNLSTTRATYNIGFYLSGNDLISTGDVLLGTNTGAWADPGVSGTYSRTLTIPTNIPPGRYWLGFLVDYDNRIGETNEGNNAMEMPRAINVL